MEFTQVKGNTWCLYGKELIPVYRMDENRCILLDSGWNWEREKLKEAMEQNGLIPVAAIATHAHTDHLGNHGWLKETYGTWLCMTEKEALLTNHESRERYCREYVRRMGSFFDDVEFKVDQIIEGEDGITHILGVPFYIHHTPGHTVDHICVGTPDNVCYLGDLVMAGEDLERVELPYHYSYVGARLSMEKMREVQRYDSYIVAHRKIIGDLDDVVEKNVAMLDRIEEGVLGVLNAPLEWDDLVWSALDATHVTVKNKFQELAYREFLHLIVSGLVEQEKVGIQTESGKRKFYRRG